MSRPACEIADVFRRYGAAFQARYGRLLGPLHLLVLKALESNGMSESDITIVNTPTDKTPQVLKTGEVSAICAGAAEEDEIDGKKRITPYWRTLKSDGEINPKYPGGAQGQKARLESEGHTVLAKGKRLLVKGFERSLVKLD